MAERSRFWDGTGLGDATEAPYDGASEFATVLMSISDTGGLTDRGGVYNDDLSELAVTSPSANTARVSSGRAMVYGSWYQNDANVDVSIPTPTGASRSDRIVLRKTWATQTVRITRIAGTVGSGVPVMTQSAGITWDVPLATVTITTGGVITVADNRTFINAQPTRLFDKIFQPGTFLPASSNGASMVPIATNSDKYEWQFAADVARTIYSTFAMPSTYAGGPITVRLYWYTPSASQSIRWDVMASAVGAGPPDPAPAQVATATVVSSATAGNQQISTISWTTSLPAALDKIELGIRRNGGGSGGAAHLRLVTLEWAA